MSITSFGVIVGAIISFITAPILSRIFTPEQYGIAGLYTNVLSYLSLFGGLMLASGIVVVRKDYKLYRLIGGLKVLWGGVFFLILLTVFLFGSSLQQLLNDTSDGYWLWILPLGFLVSKITELITALNVRAAQFKLNVKVTLGNSILGRSVSILSGYLTGGNYLAIVGSSLLNIFLAVSLQSFSSIKKVLAIPASLKSLTYTLRTLSHYPCYLLPGNVLNLFSQTAPFFIFSAFHSPSLAGIYLFSYNMLLVPFRLASKAITPVYLQKISSLFHDSPLEFRKLTVLTNSVLFWLGLLPYAVLTIWGAQIFAFVFGEAWREGGLMAQYLAFFMLFRMSTSPLSAIYRVSEEERSSFITQIVMFFSRVIPLTIGLYYFSLDRALFLFALGSLLGYFFHFHQLCRIGRLSFWRTILWQSLTFAALCGLLWGLNFLI